MPKKEKKTSSIKSLIEQNKKSIPQVVLSVIFAIIGTLLNVASPTLLTEIADKISEGLGASIDVKAVLEISLILIAMYLLAFLFTSLQGVLMANVAQKVTKSLRASLSHKINKLTLNYFDTTSTGNTMSRVTNDVDLIGQTLNTSIVSLIIAFFTVVGTVTMMFVTNVTLAISAVLASLVGFGLMILIVSKSQKYFDTQQKVLGSLNGHIEETYSGQNIVKIYNGEKSVISAFEKMNDELYTSAWKSQFLSGLMIPLMSFVENLGYVVVCIVGAVLAVQDQITIGVIVGFIMYVRMFTEPLTQLAEVATTLQPAISASGRVFELLEEKEVEDNDKNDNIKTDGNVSFKNVKFGYLENKTIINNFSMEVSKGQKIAIVGPTGAGKSTLINLLMRFYELNSGEILIDGEDISSMSYENLRSKFCMVLQDTWLFEGTVRENIVYSKENVTDAQLKTICKSVGLHRFIKTLPQGYDTVLNESTTISQGQKQLITIARAMIAGANMLILDEATSSVDTRTELIIQRAMDKLMEGKTSFVIAHRLSTIKNADVILVLKDGDIIEKGSHDELMKLDGFYANLYNSQFESVA